VFCFVGPGRAGPNVVLLGFGFFRDGVVSAEGLQQRFCSSGIGARTMR
jgi:hypothetical protein